jgi:hypothetical protein
MYYVMYWDMAKITLILFTFFNNTISQFWDVQI